MLVLLHLHLVDGVAAVADACDAARPPAVFLDSELTFEAVVHFFDSERSRFEAVVDFLNSEQHTFEAVDSCEAVSRAVFVGTPVGVDVFSSQLSSAAVAVCEAIETVVETNVFVVSGTLTIFCQRPRFRCLCRC